MNKNIKKEYPSNFKNGKKIKVSGIYGIINIINQKIYIGSSINIYNRWKSHFHDLEKGKHFNKHLQNAWDKYGKDNFSFVIIEEFNPTIDIEDKEQLFVLRERETYYIQKYNSCSNGYNIIKQAEIGLDTTLNFEDFKEGRTTITYEQLIDILDKLENTEISCYEIARILGVDKDLVEGIYTGYRYTGITKNYNFKDRSKQRTYKNINKYHDYIVKRIEDDKLTLKELADELHFNYWSLCNYVKINGINYKKHNTKIHAYTIYGTYIGEYENIRKAALNLNCNRSVIEAQLKGTTHIVNKKYWFNVKKEFKELSLIEKIFGRIINLEHQVIVEYNNEGKPCAIYNDYTAIGWKYSQIVGKKKDNFKRAIDLTENELLLLLNNKIKIVDNWEKRDNE